MDKKLNFLKEYLSLIIIIPALLGGIFQILSISMLVGMPYLRYFSVSQVVPDGLLILTILFWMCIIILIVKAVSKKIIPNDTNHLNKKKNIVLSILSLVLSISIISPVFTSKSVLFSDYFLPILASSMSLILLIVSIRSFILIFSSKDILFDPSIRKHIIYFYPFIIIIILGVFAHILIPDILNKFKLEFYETPTNYNIQESSIKVKEKFNLKDDPKLIYSNQSYSFYSVKIENQPKIIVTNSQNAITLN